MRPLLRHGTVRLAAVFATMAVLAVWTPRTLAADSDRAQKWQFTFPITFTSGANVGGEDGTSFKMNDDVGWGLGFGYNLNENFAVGADWTWLNANYNAHVVTDLNHDGRPDSSVDVSGTLDSSTVNFWGQYNILKKNITPFIRAGFGWTWVDSNIPAGAPVGSCWWDPWYGYICGTWQPTFGATEFSYGASAGVRADIAHKFMAELSYNILWIDFSKSGTQNLDGVRLNLGWKF